MSLGTRGTAALAATTFFLVPALACAWGPAAHLDFASLILEGAVAVAPAILRMLTRHADDFMYGALFADAVVAKNLARPDEHCHSWAVARALLSDAHGQGDAREAFALGYVAHLGADVVAHNHMVPQLLITHFGAKRAGHVYWEARADQRFLEQRPEIARLWDDLARRKFKAHDRFLAARLTPTLFPNRVSAGIFRRTLGVMQRETWRRAVGRIDALSSLALDQDTLLKWRALALEASRKAVNNPFSARLDNLDPTGEKALRLAALARRTLRKRQRRGGEGLDEMLRRALTRVRFVDINLFEPDD